MEKFNGKTKWNNTMKKKKEIKFDPEKLLKSVEDFAKSLKKKKKK